MTLKQQLQWHKDPRGDEEERFRVTAIWKGPSRSPQGFLTPASSGAAP